jgi:type II secretory pathway component GspD/PulD (secretin)
VASAKQLIERLDVEIVPDDSRGDIEVIFLENSSAAMIHESLEGVMSHSPSEISIDKRTNALLVRATPDEMVRIKELVAQLDRKQ